MKLRDGRVRHNSNNRGFAYRLTAFGIKLFRVLGRFYWDLELFIEYNDEWRPGMSMPQGPCGDDRPGSLRWRMSAVAGPSAAGQRR
jgi:hypothetical protein